MNQLVKDPIVSNQLLTIVEKFEDFVQYVYPITLNFDRCHNVAKDKFLSAVFGQVELLNDAGKSGQISRLYLADSGLASLRFYLRFMVHPSRKLITQHQHKVASVHLAEVGKMLGAWIRDHDSKGVERKAARTIMPAMPARAT